MCKARVDYTGDSWYADSQRRFDPDCRALYKFLLNRRIEPDLAPADRVF